MVLAFVWKSPLGGIHLFSYSCHFLFLFKSWHVKIKLSHQNLLFKYKPVHFCTGTRTPLGLVFSRLLQPPKAPSFSKAFLSPLAPRLAGRAAVLQAMTNLSPQLFTPLLAHAWRQTQSSLGLVRSSQKSWPAVDRSGLPSLSKLAQGVARIICHFHAAWDHCIYPRLIKKEGIRK